jgi:ATP-binding cassette subfamily B (MDR/TAP) protein 1
MSAIRVVIAFGMEKQEVKNYTKYLDKARQSSIKVGTMTALSLALLFMVIYSSYAYAFYMGSVFVDY